MKTLYVHIGTHKTGTSALQHFLKINKERLKPKGYMYPLFPKYKYPRKLTERNGLFLSSLIIDEQGKRHIQEEDERRVEALSQIHDYFQTYDTIILSDEALWRNLCTRPRILRHLVRDSEEFDYRLVLVIYLRRQDDMIESMLYQRIKRDPDFLDDLATYTDEQKQFLDYSYVLKCLSEYVPEENIIVRRFDESRKNGGIELDFMNLIGLELTDEYVIETGRNTSLYGNTAYIKKVINSLDSLEYKESKLFRESLTMSSGPSKRSYPCSIFSPEERAEFMAGFEDSNAAITAKYLNDGKPLFSPDYSGPVKWSVDNPYLIEDIIRSFAASDVLLQRQLDRAKEEQLRLQNQVDELQEQMDKRLRTVERRLENMRHPFKKIMGK